MVSRKRQRPEISDEKHKNSRKFLATDWHGWNTEEESSSCISSGMASRFSHGHLAADHRVLLLPGAVHSVRGVVGAKLLLS